MKKNILIILPWLPWPLTSGGNQAMFNGIKAIQDECNVFVAYMEGRKDYHKNERGQLQKILQKVNIMPCLYNPLKKIGFGLIDLICEKLAHYLIKDQRSKICRNMVAKYNLKSKEQIEFINQIIDKYNIDIVQCEMLSQLTWGLSLPKKVKKVFVHHELGYVRDELTFKERERDSYINSCMNASRMLEISTLNTFDKIITLSPIDTAKLQDAGVTTSISSSFAIVKTGYSFEQENEFRYILSFVGPENHLPNKVGIEWFLQNCWQKLLAKREYQLHIIGKWSEETITSIQSKYCNVHFLGFVPDLSEVIKNTTMIVPITIGSGIRMKILEAASCGVPIVCTSVGVEGIPFEDDIHAYIADESDEFVDKIIKLENQQNRERLRTNANKIVQTSYSIEALKDNRIRIYNSLQ